MGTSNQRVMQRAILMAAAALCVQAITNEADLAEMGEQVFMVGDPTDLPENPTKGADASFNMDDNDEDIGEHAEIMSPSDIEDEDSSHDVGASISVGRRGGMISTSGSFHMSSPGANRAGNDEEQFGEADEDEMNIGTGGRGGRGGRKRRRKSRKGWLKAQNVLRRRKARKKKSMGDKKRQKFVETFKKLCKKVQKKNKTPPATKPQRGGRPAKSGKSSKTGSGSDTSAPPLLHQDANLFMCKRKVWTGTRRRDPQFGGRRRVGGVSCNLVYKTDSANKNRHHDAIVGAQTYPTAFTENGGNWWKTCPSNCNSCSAGINQGLDFMKCCPNDAWTKNNPTDPQIKTCRSRTDTASDLKQCGFATAKCTTFKVWYYQKQGENYGMTQIMTKNGTRLETYEKDEAADIRSKGPTRKLGEHHSYKYVAWKQAKCTYANSNSRKATCTDAKMCSCVSYHDHAKGTSCGSVPKEVLDAAAMACGQL